MKVTYKLTQNNKWIKYSKLAFSIMYALAYIWTAIMVIGIVLGTKRNNIYFWIVPLALIIGIFILKDKLERFLIFFKEHAK